jgi:hypothetical protein
MIVKTKKVTPSVKLKPAVHTAIGDEQYRLKKATGVEPSYAKLIEQAWEFYSRNLGTGTENLTSDLQSVHLKQGKVPIPFTPRSGSKYQQWHSKLDHILSSGIQDAWDAVTRNIDVFYDYVVIRERERAATSAPGRRTEKAEKSRGAEATGPEHSPDLQKRTRGSA